MQNNTETQKTGAFQYRQQRLREKYAGACARTARATGIWIIARCVSAAIAFALLGAGVFAPAVAGSTVLGVAVTLGISYMLRRGVRVLAWLGAAGGVASLVMFLLDISDYMEKAAGYPLLYLYMAAAVAAALVQCAANGCLLADAEYRAFSEEVNRESSR